MDIQFQVFIFKGASSIGKDMNINVALKEIVTNFVFKTFRKNKRNDKCRVTRHTIKAKRRTYKFQLYPRNPAIQAIMIEKTDALIQADKIEPSFAARCLPIVLTKRKNKTYRFCNDYRKVNTVTIRDVYALP